jgi:glycosyltransferase involved in cell wall biosynthesis
MKILQVSNVHYIRGGADKVYFDTADLLEENGHSVLFFSTKHPNNIPTPYERYFVETNDFFEAGGIGKKLDVARRYLKNSEAAEKLDLLLQDHRPDLAHVHIFQNQLSNSILPVFRKHKIPVVMSVHEYKMLCPIYTFLDPDGEVCEKCAGGRYHHCFTKKCSKENLSYSALASMESYARDYFTPYDKYIDHFLMVSNFIRDKHIQYKSVFNHKSSRLYNFLDIKEYKPCEVQEKGDYYLYFGRLGREKGSMTQIAAFRRFPDLKLTLIGEGALEAV